MKRNAGFSLVEILVVLLIISLLMGLMATGLKGQLRASGVSEAVSLIGSELALGRQAAGVTNREMEVRFYQFEDSESPELGKAWRAFQVVTVTPVIEPEDPEYSRPGSSNFEAQVVPLNRIRKLPEGIVLIDDGEKSSLLVDPSRSAGDREVLLWKKTPATFSSFRFKPDGGTDLSFDKNWYLTLALEEDVASGNLKNFATLQMDPSTGKMTWFRP